MKIAIVGATGNVGSALVVEAHARGHLITALARHVSPQAFGASAIVTVRVDAADESALAAACTGHDAVISAMKFTDRDPNVFLNAIKSAAVPRLLVVGGAGSLEVASGMALVDTPDFPAEYKSEALAGRAFLAALQNEWRIDWTFLSPSAWLQPGAKTGKFRIGGDQLLVDARGESRISLGDYAHAMLDELETPRHSGRRFTVGY